MGGVGDFIGKVGKTVGKVADRFGSDLFQDKATEERRKKFDFLPGAFGGEFGDTPDFGQSAELANLVKSNLISRLPGSGISGQVAGVEGQSQVASAFQNPLKQALLNSQFGATTSSEEAFLKSIQEQTQGAASLRGLGPATQGALAQDLAPALIGLRQEKVSNLLNALREDREFGLTQRGQDIRFDLTQRGQDITQRGQDETERTRDATAQQNIIAQLMQLTQMARPQAIATGENITAIQTPSVFTRLNQLGGTVAKLAGGGIGGGGGGFG